MGGHGYGASKLVRLGEETGLGEILRPIWDPMCAWCPGDIWGGGGFQETSGLPGVGLSGEMRTGTETRNRVGG